MNNILNFASILTSSFQHDLIKNGERNSLNVTLKLFAFIFHFFNLLVYFMVCVSSIYTIPLDVAKVSFFMIITSNLIHTITKYVQIILNYKIIRQIMEKMPSSYSSSDEDEFKVSKRLKRSRLPFILNSVPIIAGILSSFLTPFEKNEYLDTLRFPGIENPVVYYSVNLWIRIMIMMTQAVTIINENIIYGLIIVLTVELQKLRKKILEFNKRLKRTPRENAKQLNKISHVELNNQNHKIISSELIEIINRHIELLEIRNELEDVFKFPFLVNLVCGTINLCMSEMMILIAENSLHIGSFIGGAIFLVITFYVQCYYCQQLKQSCLEISDSIYEINWEQIEDLTAKRNILMIQMRSQNSKTLTCWKFAENSFELFGSVSRLQNLNIFL